MPPSPPVPVRVPGGRDYAVHFAPLAEAPALMAGAGLEPGPCLVVTDANVARLHLAPLVTALEAAGWVPRARVVPAGEASKSVATLAALYDWALRPASGDPPDRNTPVLALGGGMVGDLAGFLAATLLRGVPLVQLPTTLLAQVDSSVGGKTGINHPAGKNLIGAFHPPRLVVADPATLATLPPRERSSGLAELVKAALIADAALVETLETDWEAVASGDALAPALRRAIEIKAAVVAEDEREAGRRAILNFGHTFAHAIEAASGYQTFTHGEAVAIGMRAALYLSARLHPALDRARADALVARLAVPPTLSEIPIPDLIAAMAGDKKRDRSGLRFVVLEEIGRARLAADVPAHLVEAAWAFARGATRQRGV
jgi:3-dehydroquinate synthase